jgi:hypothetical protein
MELEGMSLETFAQQFCVSKRSKLCKFSKQGLLVVIFYPHRSPDPDAPNYHEYCMYSLIKWKPWVGDRSDAWCGMANPTAEHLIQQWNEYARGLIESGDELPDSFQRDMRLAAREVARLAQIED